MWPTAYWAATYWTPEYWTRPDEIPPPAGGNANQDKFEIGTKESLSVTGTPTIGGRWSW